MQASSMARPRASSIVGPRRFTGAGDAKPSAAALPWRARQARCCTAAAAAADDAASTSGSASSSSNSGLPSRRTLFFGAAASLLAGGSLGVYTPAALADAALDEELAAQLPVEPAAGPELPRAYQQTVKELVKALRDAIDAEAGGAKEFEVRRKADPAKDLAKQFMRKWQDNPKVSGDASHDEMKNALQELGMFYQKNGPRSRLTAEAASSIRGHLDAVEAALPEEKKGLLGL